MKVNCFCTDLMLQLSTFQTTQKEVGKTLIVEKNVYLSQFIWLTVQLCTRDVEIANYDAWSAFAACHWDNYGKGSEVSNPFHFLFTNRMLAIRTEIHIMLVWIANREDPA